MKSCFARSYLHVLLFLPYDLNCGLMVHCWKTIDLEFVNTLLTQAVMPAVTDLGCKSTQVRLMR